MIVALHEAQIFQEHNIDDLQIEGFVLIMDGLYMAGQTARCCMYISTNLTVKIRYDKMDDELAMIVVTVGKPHQRGFNMINFYRQWTVMNQDPLLQLQSTPPARQAERFKKITNVWESLIDEGKETITLSDTNLSTSLLLGENQTIPHDQRNN